MRVKLLLASILLASLAGCATPYQPLEDNRGYQSELINQNTAKVYFTASSTTSTKTVQNYLLRRAAQVTEQQGYDYFVVTDKSDGSAKDRYQFTTDPSDMDKFNSDKTGMPTPTIQPQVALEFNPYTQNMTIKMYKGQKPDTRDNSYTAADILARK